MKSLIRICVAVLLVLCFTQTGHAALYEGTRSSSDPGEIVTSTAGHPAWPGGFVIDFAVDWTGTEWKYTYTFENTSGGALNPLITQFLKIQVSDISQIPGAYINYVQDGTGAILPLTAVNDVGFHLWDASVTDPYYSLGYHIKVGGSNTDTPPSPPVTGQLADNSLILYSSQGPMWGSFYARDGGSPHAEAVNAGFLNNLTFDESTNTWRISYQPVFDPNGDMNADAVEGWILVPNTHVVPIPPAAWLLGSGILGLVAIRRRLKK